jgi:hypothetical protein
MGSLAKLTVPTIFHTQFRLYKPCQLFVDTLHVPQITPERQLVLTTVEQQNSRHLCFAHSVSPSPIAMQMQQQRCASSRLAGPRGFQLLGVGARPQQLARPRQQSPRLLMAQQQEVRPAGAAWGLAGVVACPIGHASGRWGRHERPAPATAACGVAHAALATTLIGRSEVVSHMQPPSLHPCAPLASVAQAPPGLEQSIEEGVNVTGEFCSIDQTGKRLRDRSLGEMEQVG